MRQLRIYQEVALRLLRTSITNGARRPLLQLPTGGGKTAIASSIIRGAREKGKRVAFVVPAISLIDQSVESFWKDGIRDIGVVQANHTMTDWSKPVQVCSIQTIGRTAYPNVDVIIVDEAHKVYDAQIQWMADPQWQDKLFIGLSATPWTKGLGKVFDDLIVAATTEGLIEEGYLSPFRVFAPSRPDLTGVRTQAGDYVEKDLSKAMDKPNLVADVVETWIRMGEGRSTLCFGVDCAHAKHLQESFTKSGVNAGYMDAKSTPLEREEVRRKFASGEFKVVCNVGTLTTGVDWDVRCIVLARPTKSESLFSQIIGRGLRPIYAEGADLSTSALRKEAMANGPKPDCLILDHSDSHLKLGFVTDIMHQHLDDGKLVRQKTQDKEREERLPRLCPRCTALIPVTQRKCVCGYESFRASKIQTDAGELVELRGTGAKSSGPKNTVRMGDKWVPLDTFYGMLKHYSAEKGYKSGWAANQYRQAAGTWPNAYKDAYHFEPIPEVRSWIVSRQIAYAHAKNLVKSHAG